MNVSFLLRKGLASSILTIGLVLNAPSSGDTGEKSVAAESTARNPTRADLEKEFQESMTNSILQGSWMMTGKEGLTGHEPLSDPKEERYTITTITKTGDEHWIVNARIRYADKDITVPVLVRVVWADDTPMITIDDLVMPLLGTYSARVIFHKGFYSGIWYSNTGNYGGVLSGRILKPDDKTATKSFKTNE